MSVDSPLTTNPNTVINGFMKDYSTFLELQIKSEDNTQKLLRKELERSPDSIMIKTQLEQSMNKLKALVRELLDIRKDSDFMMDDTKTIIQTEGFCTDCGCENTTDHDFNDILRVQK